MRNLQLLALVFGTALIIGCPIPTTPSPSGCTSDSDCDSGEVCTDGACVADTTGGCTSDADCADGEVCTDGACVADTTGGCTSDADCADGEVCTDGACVADTTGGCTSDADCAEGETCTDGACAAATITGDVAAGQTFYTANGCDVCHGADASSPPLAGKTAAEILAKLDGTENHVGGTFTATEQDAADLEAYIASLQ